MEDFINNFLHVGVYKFAYKSNTQKLSVWDEVQYIKKRVQGFDRANLLETWSRKSESTTRLRPSAFHFNFLDNLKTRHSLVHVISYNWFLSCAVLLTTIILSFNNYFFLLKTLISFVPEYRLWVRCKTSQSLHHGGDSLPNSTAQFTTIGSFSRRRFLGTDDNRKWAVFQFNLSSHYHILIAKYLFTCRDE